MFIYMYIFLNTCLLLSKTKLINRYIYDKATCIHTRIYIQI